MSLRLVGSPTVIVSPGAARMREAALSPMVRQFSSPLIRQMGETTIQQRRRARVQIGNSSLYAGTPIEAEAQELGDPSVIDVGPYLANWARIGWWWNREGNCLCAYLTTRDDQTFEVRLPWSQVRQILDRVSRRANTGPVNEPTLNGFVRNLGNKIKGATKAPAKFVRNPRQFVNQSAQDLRKVVNEVGMRAVKVASHPAFAAVMTGIAATPPLQAVGGAGLAAYAAARAARPALEAADKALAAAERGTAARPRTKAGAPVNLQKAQAVASNLKRQIPQLPPALQKMAVSALRSSPADPKPRLRLAKNGVLRRR